MKTIKQIYVMAINILMSLLVSSCLKNQGKSYLEISENQLYAPQKGIDLEVDVFASTDWKILSQPTWLKIVLKENTRLLITVSENEDHFLRNGKIKVKSENDTFEIDIFQASSVQKFEKCYVTFDPDGYKGNHLFLVYTQSATKPNYYWGFTIAREQNLSNKVYSDQYRILHCNEYIYNGKKMMPTGSALLAIGESEFAYKRNGATDFTGGYHGREKFTEVNFFIDNGLMIDTNDEFEMKACERFIYMQKSIMYRDNNVHTEDAVHIKTTNISDGGYFTENRITAKKNIPINTCFGSLVSISTDAAEKGSDSDFENSISFDRNGNRKLEGYCDMLFMWNDTKKLSVNIKSKFNIYNDYATQWIWDTERYGKYYRFFRYINLNAGESWFFETKVTFDKL